MKEVIFIGSKFYGHDSAIFAVDPEKKSVFAIETERITRYKHDFIYPIKAIVNYINYEKIDTKKIKKVYFSNSVQSYANEKVAKNEYDLVMAHRSHFNANYIKDYQECNEYLNELSPTKKVLNLLRTTEGIKILSHSIVKRLRLNVYETLDDSVKKFLSEIFPNAEIDITYVDHQLCHALSSYYTSDFDDALLITSDGYGDGKFSSVYVVKNKKVNLFSFSKVANIKLKLKGAEQMIGLSPGIVYSYFTESLGFKSDSDEGKVEALAAFGDGYNDIYKFLIKNTWLDKDNNCISFNYKKIEQYLDVKSFEKVIKNYKREDVAAAVQKYLEDIHLEYITHVVKKTGISNVCFSGGVAANVILNLKIYEQITKNLHITPAMADDGTAQGAAIQSLLNNGYSIEDLSWLKEKNMPYFSTSYSKEDVLDSILKYGKEIKYKDLGDNWPKEAAKLVNSGKIGAIFHGRMEWGPRALGNRSIIADPRRADIKKEINLNIKKRPEFQPFCPSILLEEKDRLFTDAYNNKHMTCAFRLKKEYWKKLPGAIHIDGTSRVQFVEENDNPKYYQFLKELKNLTGFGVVINTSFNKHGRTIVETPHDALIDFFDTNLDFLIIEGVLIKK